MHTDNYEFKCPEFLPRPNQNVKNGTAIDLHIVTGAATVQVLGIDGIDPNAANSPHGLGVDGQGKIEIDGINVKPGGTVRVRIKHNQPAPAGNKRLPNLKYTWTYPPGVTGNEDQQT